MTETTHGIPIRTTGCDRRFPRFGRTTPAVLEMTMDTGVDTATTVTIGRQSGTIITTTTLTRGISAAAITHVGNETD